MVRFSYAIKNVFAELVQAPVLTTLKAKGAFPENHPLSIGVRGSHVAHFFNKCDLATGIPVADTYSGPPRFNLSALTGKGLPDLRAHLKQSMGYQTLESGTVSARQRHLRSPWPCRC